MAEPLDADTLALGRDPKHLAVLDEALAATPAEAKRDVRAFRAYTGLG
jgi:hypothetical protein